MRPVTFPPIYHPGCEMEIARRQGGSVAFTAFTTILRGGVCVYRRDSYLRTKSARSRTHTPSLKMAVNAVNGGTPPRRPAVFSYHPPRKMDVNLPLGGARMTLVRTVRDDGYVNVQMVACPYCGEPMDPQASFRQHWRGCSASATETTQ